VSHSDHSGCDHPAAPDNRPLPPYLSGFGCLLVITVPPAPMTPAAQVAYGTAHYFSALMPLVGLTVEPELFPPIHSV